MKNHSSSGFLCIEYCHERKLSFFCSWRAKNVVLLRLMSMVFLCFTPLPPLTNHLTKIVPFSGSLDHLGCHQVSAGQSLSCRLNCMLNGETYQHVRTLRKTQTRQLSEHSSVVAELLSRLLDILPHFQPPDLWIKSRASVYSPPHLLNKIYCSVQYVLVVE